MANNILNGHLLNSSSKTIAVSAAILAVSSVLSRLLGVLRDWLLTEYFGAGAELDVYYAAFRIPDFIYNILVFGGIVVAFLPLFSDYYSKNKENAWRFANNTLNVFTLFLVVTSLILFIFAPCLMPMVAPGFDAAQLDKTVFLTRLMFLSPIIFGIASVFSGVLQYFGRFLAYSLAALFYNIGIIAGIIILSPSIGITGVAVGVILGAFLYLLIQIPPAMKCGFRYQTIFSLKERSLRQVVNLMLPRTLGVAANQINLIVPTIIGSGLAAGSITIFNLATNIYSLPIGIIGVSWATAAFAPFSKYFSQGKTRELSQKFSLTYREIGYLVVPAGILVFVLRQHLVDLLYFHGQFTAWAAALTAASLGIFCLGIYFASMMPVLFRLFFALKDTASPTLTTVVSVAVNVILNYVFVALFAGSGRFSDIFREVFGLQAGDISVLGLALAYSLANALQFAMLMFMLLCANASLVRAKEIFFSFVRSIVAGIFMGIAVYLTIGVLPHVTLIERLISLALASVVAIAVYLTITAILGSSEIKMVSGILNKIFKRSKAGN